MSFNFQTVKRFFAVLAILPVFVLSVACGKDSVTGDDKPGGGDDPDTPGGETEEVYEDIKVVDGKVRFYLSEKKDATRTIAGLSARNWETSKVVMNGKTYDVELTDEETPRPFVEVAASGSDSYNATLIGAGSTQWYGASSYADVKLTHSQFYQTAVANIKSFPMYAAYSKENGNKLIFNDGFAMVCVRLRGSAKISSVKVENPTGGKVAGLASFLPSKGAYTVNKGMDFAVMNCTNDGEFVTLSTTGTRNFMLMIAPGTYSQGLKVSICDSERGAMFKTLPAMTLEPGQVYFIDETYACEEDLVFYEGFDNFVWGGDIMKGQDGIGFSPTADKMGISSGVELTGYENAFAEVAYDNPGTGYFQPNVWDEVSGKTVAEAHTMSESYIKSRNLGDFGYLYRAQERPGYVVIGEGQDARGIVYSPNAKYYDGIGEMKASIRFAVAAGFSMDIEMRLAHGGVIKEVSLDGTPLSVADSKLQYRGGEAYFYLPKKLLSVPASAAVEKRWHTVEFTVNGATDGAKFYINTNSASTGKHGIYIDSIEARKVSDWNDDNNLRVLLWNIQNGMIADQHNNYDNFVKWVKQWDADICIWCESETIYKDKSGTGTSSKFLPDGWAQLCTRYGHSYAAVGGNRDNYPQTVTSKYPIKTVKRITDTDKSGKPVSHGAGHFTIEVHGKKINIVTLHMWPQKYGFGVSTANRETSAAAKEGDYYRQHEMQYIVDQTVKAYPNEEYWIFGGDTNSNSRHDDWYTGYSKSDPTRLITHDVVINQTNLKDVVVQRDCYGEKNNVMFRSRIDVLYASPKLFDCITNSTMLMDDWTGPQPKWTYHTAFVDPSDHTAVLVDFKL